MKMICIKNEDTFRFYGVLPLTPGKIYDVIAMDSIPFSNHRPFDYTGPTYTIIDDNGEASTYTTDIIRKLNKDEERELKLKELGI